MRAVADTSAVCTLQFVGQVAVTWFRWLLSGLSSRRLDFNSRTMSVCSVVNTETLGQVPLSVLRFSLTTLIAPLLPAHILLISDGPIIKAVDSIHSVVCLMRVPYLLPKTVPHRLQSNLPLSITASCLFPQGYPIANYDFFLFFPSILPFIFPSITRFRKQFLRRCDQSS